MDVKTAVLLCCAAAAAFPAVARETLTLVRDGAAEATIVIGAKPTKAARFAAAEFRHVVKLMTGAELPVAAEKPSAGVAERNTPSGSATAVSCSPVTTPRITVRSTTPT